MTMPEANQSPIEVVHFADPWCWWSWGLEPILQRIRAVYGEQIRITYRMGGMAESISSWRREYEAESDEGLKAWINDSNSITGSPVDPESHLKAKVTSSWPACIAMKAAQLQSEKSAERFFRKLMEQNLLFGRNGSDETVYLEAARQVGLDTALLRTELASGKPRALFEADRKAMDASFLTLSYTNNETKERVNVESVFSANRHEGAIEKLTEGKLSKRTPVDILEYLEHEAGFLIGTKEVAELFATSEEDVQNRLSKLAKDGLVENRRFPFGASYWLLSPDAIKARLTVD